MSKKKVLFRVSIVAMPLVLFAWFVVTFDAFGNKDRRETIFDKKVFIPKKLILDVPNIPPLCDEIEGLKKGFVDVENGRLYYEEEGEGIPLILLNPGPGGTHHNFHPYFSQIKDVARIIYYDVRGVGKSSKDETGKTYTIKQAVEDVENLRKALKIDKWAVLGWSFGGFLAQCYALTYPDHIKGLILVAAADGLTKVKMKPEREQKFISQEERDAIEKIYVAKAEGKLNLIQMGYNKDLCGDWKRQHYYKPTQEEFVRLARYEFVYVPGYDILMSNDYKKISLDGKFDDFEIPTLVIEAKWDLTWDTDKANFIRENHPRAQFEYFEKSGHKIFADEPERFFNLLRSFLEKSNESEIVYRPGNRLTWPKPLSEFELKIMMASFLTDKKEGERLVVTYYQQAVRENIEDAAAWNAFFLVFVKSKKYYEEGLGSLQRYESVAKTQNLKELGERGHCIKVWYGMLFDLLGRRDEAIKSYREALQNFKEESRGCSVSKKWINDRLKKPFTWDDDSR